VSEVYFDVHEATNIGHRPSVPCHELQEAIAGILTQAAAALEEPGLALTSRRYLEQIVQQAHWLQDMIEDFLRSAQEDMAHQGTAHNGPVRQGTVLPDIVRSQTVQPDTVQPDTAPRAGTTADDAVARGADVTEVVDDTVAVARLTWSGQINVTSPGEPARCRLHPILLRRVISNVLSNAMRAAGPHGSVTIQIRRYQDMAMVSMRDTGPGFGKIPGGFGIGLAEVARIIAGNDGRLELGNTAGGGVRVSLWLPGEADRHSP
jgi:signal transduction histidine kinase